VKKFLPWLLTLVFVVGCLLLNDGRNDEKEAKENALHILQNAGLAQEKKTSEQPSESTEAPTNNLWALATSLRIGMFEEAVEKLIKQHAPGLEKVEIPRRNDMGVSKDWDFLQFKKISDTLTIEIYLRLSISDKKITEFEIGKREEYR